MLYPYAPVRVYPRVRGGTFAQTLPGRRPLGLSPRARGNPGIFLFRPQGQGSIPACAGEPVSTFGSLSSMEVYPRVRGGTLYILPALLFLDGLSPRARGNQY